jgi:hypothetical protein
MGEGQCGHCSGYTRRALSPSARHDILSNILPRAALYGDTETVCAILLQAVDLERRSLWDGTALMHAAERGLPDMVVALLRVRIPGDVTVQACRKPSCRILRMRPANSRTSSASSGSRTGDSETDGKCDSSVHANTAEGFV